MNNSLVQSLLDGSEESARVFIHGSHYIALCVYD